MSKASRKKLYRSTEDEIIAGIFGGLGEYFNVDSNLLRLVGLLVFALTGFIPFMSFYLIAYFIIPIEKEAIKEKREDSPGKLFIPAGIFVGMGFGFLFNDLTAGLLIGLGVGLFLFATYEIFKKHE